MCGRYEFQVENMDDMLESALCAGTISADRVPKGEICPGRSALAILARNGVPTAVLMRWGFDGPHGLVINARSETASRRSMFQGCVRAYRCLLPASGYYEWHKVTGAKYRVGSIDARNVYMAGLYLPLPDEPARFVVITRAATGKMADLHPRTPMILTSKQDRLDWLLRPERAEALLADAEAPNLITRAVEPEQLNMFEDI